MEKILKNISPGLLFIVFLATSQALSAAEESIPISDAVLRTLRANPGVRIEEARVKQKEGLLQMTSGQFDWVAFGEISREDATLPFTEAQRALIGLQGQSLHEESTNYSLGVTKQFRNGVRISPFASVIDYKDDVSQSVPANQVQVGLEIVVPLLRGLGTEDTGAEEFAAKSNLLATYQLSKHIISRQVFLTTWAYWQCLAAKDTIEILDDGVKRVQEILNIVELLVQGGEASPDLLNQAKAKVLLLEVGRREAVLALYKSRQDLALAMGYTPEELAAAPVPEGGFPEVIDAPLVDRVSPRKLITESLNHRADYKAARTNIGTEQILLTKAEKQRRPRLNFDIKLGYAALDESNDVMRYLRSYSSNTKGPNVFAGLVMELPIENNTARGDTVRRRAVVKEAELAADSLASNVGSEVLSALEALRSYAIEYQYATRSRSTYERAIRSETLKLQLGQLSLTTLIQLEDDHLHARLAQLNAISKYAQSLAQLRFASGALLSEEDKALRFSLSSLTTLPFMD